MGGRIETGRETRRVRENIRKGERGKVREKSIIKKIDRKGKWKNVGGMGKEGK